MADFKKPKSFIKKFEGEASKNKSDSASINCTSGCRGTFKGVTSDQWHTRYGITWCTFNAWAERKNIPTNERCTRFINMSESDWLDIWKSGFWDKIKGDEIKSQAIAEYWANAKWGNPSTANRFIAFGLNKNGFNVDEDDVDGMVSAINSIKNKKQELQIFNDIIDARISWLNSLSSASKNRGWFKRQESFRKRGRALIKSRDSVTYKALYSALGTFDSDFRTANSEVKDNTLMIGIGVLGVSLLALYFIDKKIKNK